MREHNFWDKKNEKKEKEIKNEKTRKEKNYYDSDHRTVCNQVEWTKWTLAKTPMDKIKSVTMQIHTHAHIHTHTHTHTPTATHSHTQRYILIIQNTKQK